MCIFTHFAAGALAGGLTGNVYVGAAAGLASHAVLDVIPHYDHPDWRLELAGGIVSLVLLLLMPFVTWPAVVGGLFGMVPDIENLLQKLGKMRRDQFIYPTHTGLLPHGRTLGPKSIGWQFAIFAGCFLLLGLFSPQMAQAAGSVGPVMAEPVVQVLTSGAEKTVLRIDFPVLEPAQDWQVTDPMRVQWALPMYAVDKIEAQQKVTELSPPRLRLSLAVPTRQAVSWTTRNVEWWKEPTDLTAAGQLVEFSRPVVARSVPLTGTEIPLAPGNGILRSVTIEVSHRATGQQRSYLDFAAAMAKREGAKQARQQARAQAPVGILNPELFEALTVGGQEAARQVARASADKAATQDLFALTNHWVKLNLTGTGLYRFTGQELSNLGVSTSGVDPAKLRLYRGGSLQLSDDPELPDDQQGERIRLNEVALEVLDGGDGEWNLDDEFRFYGVGTSTWLDRLDPAGGRLEFYDHPFAAEAVYWLSWEDDVTGSPLPGTPRRVLATTATPTGGEQQATARIRMHREEQFLDTAGLVQDNWVWDNTIFAARTEDFSVRTPVPGASTRFQVDIRGVFGTKSSFVFDAKATLNGDEAAAATLNFTKSIQDTTARMLLVGDSVALTAGTNQITISNTSAGTSVRAIALDSYDILYWTNLDLASGLGQLDFAHWGDQVAVPGTPVDLVLTAPAGQTPLLWDVSDPANAAVFTGTAGANNSFTYGVVREPGTDRHFVAAVVSDLLSPVSGLRANPVSLRARTADLDYIVVTASAFSFVAQDLAAYRRTSLPGVVSPVTAVVTVDDIYDNFAGGQKDPFAIRNYLKWVYDQGAHRLQYVCLLGNASRDYRNYLGRTPLVDLYDLVATEMRTAFPRYPRPLSRQLAYAADDGLVSFETAPPNDLDFPDLACGRLPALNAQEAREMVDRTIAYETTPTEGLWQNDILLTADDVVRPIQPYFPGPYPGEHVHTFEAEDLYNRFVPLSLDVRKVYGVDYDFPPGSVVKPAARADINTHLNGGTTIYYYVGHGSEDNLADEQIFQSRDIANLSNGMKRPIFMAFSCDVGIYDSPSRRSMAEQFLQYETGGAIGCICASQVSFTFNNDALTESFFANLFPDRHVSPVMTISAALRQAKEEMTISSSYRSNSQRYNFFGDPGLRLPHPVDDLSLAATSVDTLRTGARQTVVMNGSGKVLLGAGDNYSVLVEESAKYNRYAFNTAFTETTFVVAGAPVFAGTGTVPSGDLVIPFKVPTQMRYGDSGRVRLLVETPDGWHAAAASVSAVRAATGPNDDVIGPAINLAFTDNQYRVQPGAELTAVLQDTSGVAILGTSPGNSLLLEFDNTGFMTDVTTSFGYEPDSYTSGRLSFPLPRDLPAGRHLAALHASDVLGNVGSDTLSFEIGEAGQGTINSVTLFPNPTPGYCRLLFELGDPMEVQWDIYTLAGSRLRTMRAKLGAGPQVLEWDGLDGRNDEIANGTYLYVLRGLGAGADGREIRKTGKLVIMR